MANNKGLIILDAKSAILHEQLQPRILEGKREPCEITFSDFDEVSYKISCSPETPNIVVVNMAMKAIPALKRMGSQAVIDKLFPGLEVQPAIGYDLSIQFDCDSLSNPSQFLTSISELKRNIMSGPFENNFTALQNKTSDNLTINMIQYRKNEAIFICPSASKIVVIFVVDFNDVTDKVIAKVFLQEFLEAQRTIRNAPPVSFSRDPPGELSKISHPFKSDVAGYLSFAVEERHITGTHKEKAITLLTGFRNYLHYHIKCSKTYLHMRMRKRVAGWMLVLNRAVPEYDNAEKKTATGKTFTRK